jgi:predicted transcriptional regulator
MQTKIVYDLSRQSQQKGSWKMSIARIILSMLLLITSGAALAEAPTVQSPLPPLKITDRGELKLEDNEFSYTPWGSEQNHGKVHIVQYFGGTKKRKFPLSTMVLDEDGAGVSAWQLGKPGAGLVILDSQGIVRYFTTEAMSAEEMRASVDLVRSNMDS